MSNDVKTAEGLVGILMNSSVGVYLRVYTDSLDTQFRPLYKDYKIGHPDMMVQIIDSDAYIFPSDDKNFGGIVDIDV